MLNYKICLLAAFVVILFHLFSLICAAARDGTSGCTKPQNWTVDIGVVLDFKSPFGTMVDACISMAVSDFYSLHPNYKTRLSLHSKHADNALHIASAVLGLLKNEQVHSILVGPQSSTEATIAAELAEKAHVPIISFTTRYNFTFPTQSSFFVRTTSDDWYQAKALAAICQGFEWQEVVVLYEDSDYGTQFISHLNEPFQEANIKLCYMSPISPLADDSHISKELDKLKTMKNSVVLVHAKISLGARLIPLAQMKGLMSTGYAWIVTDGLSNFLNSMDFSVIDSMEGVLGIRPYIPRSENLRQFKARWKRNMPLMTSDSNMMELNVYGLWAYDTIWSLAMAVEKNGYIKPSFSRSKHTSNGTDITNLRVSKFGPKILTEILDTKFEGLSGDFRIVDGHLQTSAFEIINIIGSAERTVGYWTRDRGIVRDLEFNGKPTYSTSTEKIKKILWPGDTYIPPKAGWTPWKWRVLVPEKDGFHEFVNVKRDPVTKKIINVTGFSIDIFHAAVNEILRPVNHNYEYISFKIDSGQRSGSYNNMLRELAKESYDMVVGDTTILAERAQYVDFSLPYSESGLVMVVKNKMHRNMWKFIEPLRWDLWVTIFAACIFIGVALRNLEHRAGTQAQRSTEDQPIGLQLWFPIAILAFPERNMVVNNWSRFVLVVWLFMAFILMQSYTTKLSAIFTVDQLRFALDYNVGHQAGSFTRDLLIKKLHYNESKLKPYSTIEEFDEAMTLGSENGGIDAIFDEIPYMKLLLRRYANRYRTIGQTYKTDGLGFAFPMNSPLVPLFSRAILNVTQGPAMAQIEESNFGPPYEDFAISQELPSLTTYNFGGLFIIVGSATFFALFCSICPLGQYFCKKVTEYSKWCISFLPFNSTTPIDQTEKSNVDNSQVPQEGTEEHLKATTSTTSDNKTSDQDRNVVHSDEGVKK